MAIIQIKRGLAANLPSVANPGELILTLDAGLLYAGNSAGTGLIQLTGLGSLANATTSVAGLMSATDKTSLNTLVSAGPGSIITLYNPGPTNCWVMATGSGVTLSITNNIATFATFPAGVLVLSATVYFTATNMGSNTAFNVILPAGYGVGANYITPVVQCFKDVGGSRGTNGTINFNTAQNEITVTGLTSGLAYVCHIGF